MVIYDVGSVTSQCDRITEGLIHCYIVDFSGLHSAVRLAYSTMARTGWEVQLIVGIIVSNNIPDVVKSDSVLTAMLM